MAGLINSFWGASVTDWNAISTGTDASKSLDVSSEHTTNAYGITMKPDGTKLYCIGIGTDRIYQYSGTAWDISTFTYDSKNILVSGQDAVPLAVRWKTDGTKMYMCGNGDKVFQYSASTAWDISTCTYDTVSLSVTLNAFDMYFIEDGSQLVVLSNTSDTISFYDMSTPWLLSSATIDATRTVSVAGTNPRGLYFNPNGKQMYIGFLTNAISEYKTTTAWDFSASSIDNSLTVNPPSPGTESVFFRPDGTNFYTLSRTNLAVYQWNL